MRRSKQWLEINNATLVGPRQQSQIYAVFLWVVSLNLPLLLYNVHLLLCGWKRSYWLFRIHLLLVYNGKCWSINACNIGHLKFKVSCISGPNKNFSIKWCSILFAFYGCSSYSHGYTTDQPTVSKMHHQTPEFFKFKFPISASLLIQSFASVNNYNENLSLYLPPLHIYNSINKNIILVRCYLKDETRFIGFFFQFCHLSPAKTKIGLHAGRHAPNFYRE